jgi:hypothetical protein
MLHKVLSYVFYFFFRPMTFLSLFLCGFRGMGCEQYNLFRLFFYCILPFMEVCSVFFNLYRSLCDGVCFFPSICLYGLCFCVVLSGSSENCTFELVSLLMFARIYGNFLGFLQVGSSL